MYDVQTLLVVYDCIVLDESAGRASAASVRRGHRGELSWMSAACCFLCGCVVVSVWSAVLTLPIWWYARMQCSISLRFRAPAHVSGNRMPGRPLLIHLQGAPYAILQQRCDSSFRLRFVHSTAPGEPTHSSSHTPAPTLLPLSSVLGVWSAPRTCVPMPQSPRRHSGPQGEAEPGHLP